MNILQVAQEEYAAVPEKTERETVLIARRTDAADLIEKRGRNGRSRAADRNDGAPEKEENGFARIA